MAYTIRTNVRRVVYARPAARAAVTAGAATGLGAGTVAYDRAPPIELAYIVHYPDASGLRDATTGRLDPQVVTVSRAVPTLSTADVTREYATVADFEAAVLQPLLGASATLAALAPGVPVDGSTLRWQRTALAAE